MKAFISNQSEYFIEADNNQNVDFLAQQWANKYVLHLQIEAEDEANNCLAEFNRYSVASWAGKNSPSTGALFEASVQNSEANCQRQSLEH